MAEMSSMAGSAEYGSVDPNFMAEMSRMAELAECGIALIRFL